MVISHGSSRSTSLFSLYLGRGGVLALGQRQCMLGWGVVTNTPLPHWQRHAAWPRNLSYGNWADITGAVLI